MHFCTKTIYFLSKDRVLATTEKMKTRPLGFQKTLKVFLLTSVLIALLLGGCKGRGTPVTLAPAAGEASVTESKGTSTTEGATARPETDAPAESTALAEPTAPAEKPGAPALAPGQSPLLISEVMAGKQGNNTFEFIELYNRSEQAVDIQGWALWYRLPNSKEDLFVYRWQEHTLVGPYAHYLLTFRGQEVGAAADAGYEQALNVGAGGLQLRQRDGKVLDTLGWGTEIKDYCEGQPAKALKNGLSLERLPGGQAGNSSDGGSNASDFVLREAPAPQNSGSPITPLPKERLEIAVSAPLTSTPGSTLTYTVVVSNSTGQTLHNLAISLPIPAALLDENAENPVAWRVDSLDPGASSTFQYAVAIPFRYFTAELRNAFVQAEDWAMPAFAAPARTTIAGGRVSIAVGRTLIGSEITLEGTASMYTGGYFAGSGNVKFYLADESGGIQVQVFGGQGLVNVRVGDRVRVRGKVDLYRGAAEIVPIAAPEDIEILARADEAAGSDPAPLAVTLADIFNDNAPLQGRLLQVSGQATRVEEFSYSYEIDLSDEAGKPLTLYVDKQTGVNVELVESGQRWQAAGILEMRDGKVQLYPRFQTDLQEVFPPILRLEADGPSTVDAGAAITYTLQVFNHTEAAMNEVLVTAPAPVGSSIEAVLDGGQREGAAGEWRLNELAAGEGAVLRLVVRLAPATRGAVLLKEAAAQARQWPEWANAPEVRTFVGGRVPVWAIQGEGFRSPYLFERVTTSGVVTGIFPDLQGFFIQETDSDEDGRTSPGLFVSNGSLAISIAPGDSVVVTGTVREPAQQTTLLMATSNDVQVLAQGGSLPEPIPFDPPASAVQAREYSESLEGTLVQVSEAAVAVAPTTQYGETVLALAKHGVQRLFQGDDNGIAIMVDDGSNAAYRSRAEMPFAIAAGEMVSGVIGPLGYSYGRYKIEPIATPISQANPGAEIMLPEAGEDEFTLMTWNTENLFDTRAPHPSDPPLPSRQEYEVDLAKVENTILAAGAPAVVALQEVENLSILQTLASRDALAGYGYQAVLMEGADSRGIDVGYLVRGDVQIVSVTQRAAPEGLTSRPPLVLQLLFGDTTIYVINNHFTSMSGGEQATEPTRLAQAAWNATLVEEIQAVEPEALIAVVGDLNSYLVSPPIERLRTAGLAHVFDLCTPPDAARCPQGRPYTYIYQGEAQVLDHILVSAPLFERLARVEVLHVNADFPLPDEADTSPTHKSDHDPVVAVFGVP